MSSTIEGINNAIASITRHVATSNASKGVKEAVASLGENWATFWRSNERAILPDVALGAKLERYIKWYTRAWLIAPADVRAKVPRPDTLDASKRELVLDLIARWTAGAKDVADDSAKLAAYVGKGAEQLTIATGSGLKQIAMVLGSVLIGLWWFTRKKG